MRSAVTPSVRARALAGDADLVIVRPTDWLQLTGILDRSKVMKLKGLHDEPGRGLGPRPAKYAGDWNAASRLRVCIHGLCSGRVGRQSRPRHEEIVVVHVAIHAAGNFSGFWTEGGTSTFKEDHNDDAPDAGVGIGCEPSKARACMRAGSGLAEDFFFIEVQAKAACRAVSHRPGHAIGDFRNQSGDVELALHARLKVCDFFGSRRMLQVVESSAIGDGGDH